MGNAEAGAAPAGPTIYELMSETPETRRTSGNFRHSVREVLAIAFLCELCGGHSARKYAAWGRENEGRLRACGLELPHGVPSHHTFSRVLAVLPPTVLKRLERRWSLDLRDIDDGEVVAIDGKALKHASADGVHVPYVVSAWATGAGFVMGEVKTDENSTRAGRPSPAGSGRRRRSRRTAGGSRGGTASRPTASSGSPTSPNGAGSGA